MTKRLVKKEIVLTELLVVLLGAKTGDEPDGTGACVGTDGQDTTLPPAPIPKLTKPQIVG